MMRNTLIVMMGLLIMTQGSAAIHASEAVDPAQLAREKLNEGQRLEREGKLPEAAAAFLNAVELYEQALKKNPEDKASRQNHLYCLGQRGWIYVRKGQQAMNGKDFVLAAELYGAAISAYDLALQKLPQEKNFLTNRRYCRNQWGMAQFQVKLATQGTAYPFQLTGLDGSPIALEKIKGQVILLEFVTGWCPSCRESLPLMEELQKQFKDKAARVVVLALDRLEDWKRSGSEEKILALARGKEFAAAWADEETYLQYGAFNSVPTVILIGKAGKISAHIPKESRTREELARRIAELL